MSENFEIPVSLDPLVPEDGTLTSCCNQDCPICMTPIPFDTFQSIYSSCCGKVICKGCITKSAMKLGGQHGTFDAICQGKTNTEPRFPMKFALVERAPCAFCRDEGPKGDEDRLARTLRRIESPHHDTAAMVLMGHYHFHGKNGLPKDPKKAIEFWERAASLGDADAFNELASEYNPDYKDRAYKDRGNANKYRMCLEQAAKGGHLLARMKLSRWYEEEAGVIPMAVHHAMVAACKGQDIALDDVKRYFMDGWVSKDDFAKALRFNQAAHDERNTEDRKFALIAQSFQHSMTPAEYLKYHSNVASKKKKCQRGGKTGKGKTI